MEEGGCGEGLGCFVLSFFVLVFKEVIKGVCLLLVVGRSFFFFLLGFRDGRVARVRVVDRGISIVCVVIRGLRSILGLVCVILK